jgi:hypothetical protein
LERALDPELLSLALGEHAALPSASELAARISEAEIGLLLQRTPDASGLLRTGWYLHTVAAARQSLDLYGLDRQRAAFRVAAHIFDVAIQQPGLSLRDRLEYSFASQTAYLRSSVEPNSFAVYRRELLGRLPQFRYLDDRWAMSLAIGAAILALDADYLFSSVPGLADEAGRIARAFDATDLFGTPFAAAEGVRRGVWDLLIFLVYGRIERLSAAQENLTRAVTDPASVEDHVPRWVAAHLLSFAEGLDGTSIWTALPPEVPPGIRRAFAFTSPRVTSLSDMELEPIEWLKELSLTEWRAQLGVTSSEFTNIFECVRPTRGGLVARVLAGDTFEFAVALEQDVPQPVEVAVHSIGDESPPDLVLVADGNRLGAIPNDRYNDVVTLIATGVQLSFEVRQTPDGGMVRVWMQNLE